MKIQDADAEYYFIQFLFCQNRDLLRRDSRELYDAMFMRYEKVYEQGREAKVDLFDINKKFVNELLREKK